MDAELFVGREGEVGLLRDLVARVAAGEGGVVLVTGEQGVGKSALLRAGLGEAKGLGCEVLWGAADELGQRFPLRLMAECVGSAGGWGGGLAGGGLAGGGVGGGVLGGGAVPAGVEGMLAAVDRLCARGPVVLLAEDLQWADEASVLVWHRLSRAVGQVPLLLAGSWRPGAGREDLVRLGRGVGERGGVVVELGPLAAGEAGVLAGALAGGRPGRGLAELVGRAGGNPLYARELVEGLVRDGRVRVAGGVAELAGGAGPVAVPGSLAAAIGGRLGWLAEDVVGVLRWAAVLGAEFSVLDLEVVTGRSAGELAGVVDAAVAAGVVAEAGVRLGFRHGLIRQVLYEGMPAGVRAALHVQAARALAGAGAAPERVAAQLLLAWAVPQRAGPESGAGADPDPGGPPSAGDAQPWAGADVLAAEPAAAWVVGWLADAAPVLIYRAPQVAADMLRYVLSQLPGTDPHREGLEASLLTVALLLQRYEEVDQAGARALARASDPDQAAEMSWLVGYARMRTGRLPEGVAVVTQALGRPGLSDVHAARLRALHANILIVAGETDQAAEAGRQALAAGERTGDRLATGYALHALSGVNFVRRDHAAILENVEHALAVVDTDPQTTDLRLLLLANKTFELAELDRRPEAIANGRLSLALAERAGTPRLEMIRTTLAVLYFEAGEWDDSLAELELASGLSGPAYIRLVLHGLPALIAGHRDDRAVAARHLRAMEHQDIAAGSSRANSQFLLMAQSLAAERAGQAAEATAVLAQCLQPGIGDEMPGRYAMLPPLTRLALAGGDRGTAAAAAQTATAEAEREPLPIKIAVADQCRGLVTGDPAAVLAAAAYFEGTGRVLEQAQAREDAAVLAAAAGDLSAARQSLATATGLYTALGAGWDARRAVARLRSYGIRPGRGAYRARATTGWAALTPTELKIAYLVADGRSNPDVAAELFLSRNTVQTHVSHILAKLAAGSRAEIIREALRHPPDRQSPDRQSPGRVATA